MDWTLFGAMVTGFFAIINPVSTAPIFANVTAGNSAELRAQVARRAVAIAFGVIALFTVSGNLIFSLFGITLTAFRIVGGVLVAIARPVMRTFGHRYGPPACSTPRLSTTGVSVQYAPPSMITSISCATS